MLQEKIEYLISKFYFKYSIPIVMTFLSVYFWVAFLNSNSFKIIGLIINIAGLIFWWSAKLTLSANWGVGFGKPKIKQLVTHGIYSKISHPMYWGIILTLTGLAFLNTKIWFTTACLLIIIYFIYRMIIENNYLSKQLGEKYKNYKRKTWI
jgi:protein-S-isoprenylcysteine O-methyltransferase Ste14